MSAGHFGQISLFLPLYAILELPNLHGAGYLAGKDYCIIVAYDQGLNPPEFRVCSSGSSGVVAIHDPPFCTACCFLPGPRVHPLGEQ